MARNLTLVGGTSVGRAQDRLATPDLPKVVRVKDARELYCRPQFRVGDLTFVCIEPGEYACDDITVYCDQQDSCSWAARRGGANTGYFWTPEWAVMSLLDRAPILH
jgi:hypothetical protein